MSNRQVSCGKLFNPHFIGVICFIIFNYYIFVYEYLINLHPAPFIILLVIFHILFFMLLWSHIKSVIGDPGRVPIYWGFFAEQSQNKKRRYCLLCHSFKPERCHHCSNCQRCVLNMDHHCPWISNCVGFSNRKFFMLFLFYIILTLTFAIGCQIPLFIMEIIDIVNEKASFSVHTVLRGIGLLVQIAFYAVIISFFKFHIDLVLENSSTIDNLEKIRNPNADPNVYNIGPYENFVQVFGTNNKAAWLLPIEARSSNKANGVVWPKKQ